MSLPDVINIQDAETHLSRYVDSAAAGEEIVVGKAGKPLAILMPYKAPGKPRKLASLVGMITETPDAWSPETDAGLADLLLGNHESADEQDSPSFLLVADEPTSCGR